MSRVVVAISLMSVVLGSTAAVRAEEPVAPPAGAPVPCATVPAVDVAAEQRAFEREMELFARRWDFTQRLVAQREARAFEEAEARYVRFAELTRKLAEGAAAEAERQFDAAVTLFVKKRELTRALAEAPKASEHAAPAAAPIPAPAR
jgi:hypothetical protein